MLDPDAAPAPATDPCTAFRDRFAPATALLSLALEAGALLPVLLLAPLPLLASTPVKDEDEDEEEEAEDATDAPPPPALALALADEGPVDSEAALALARCLVAATEAGTYCSSAVLSAALIFSIA